MPLDRRSFVLGMSAAATAAAASQDPRDLFEWPRHQTYLNSAGMHPLPAFSRKAVDSTLDYLTLGPGEGRGPVTEDDAAEVKRLYAQLIGAKPNEIAFIQSTQVGENIVTDGLGLPEKGGNIVTDEFHFHGGLYHLKQLAERGMELRIVKQRDWRVEQKDLESAVDRNTRLVALTLVCNLNGFQHDAKFVRGLAHAHGAYFYADIIQAAGCVPLDVRAMGIDFAAAATFKWLLGLHGFGYLYVREELQGEVLRTRRFGDRHYGAFKYHNLPGSPAGPRDFTWSLKNDASRYEIGSFSDLAVACQKESLRYLLDYGVENIRKRVKPLTDRVLAEVPRLGYTGITPGGSATPIAAFLADDEAKVQAKLARANVNAKVKWGQLRVSPSLFNTQGDVDRLLEALA